MTDESTVASPPAQLPPRLRLARLFLLYSKKYKELCLHHGRSLGYVGKHTRELFQSVLYAKRKGEGFIDFFKNSGLKEVCQSCGIQSVQELITLVRQAKADKERIHSDTEW